MTTWPTTGVVGAGAVGSFFGGMLARAGAPVTFFGRPGSASPHLAAIREKGLAIDGAEVRETIEVAVAGGYAGLERAELVLFAVKSLDTESAASGIQHRLAPGALVVSLRGEEKAAQVVQELADPEARPFLE